MRHDLLPKTAFFFYFALMCSCGTGGPMDHPEENNQQPAPITQEKGHEIRYAPVRTATFQLRTFATATLAAAAKADIKTTVAGQITALTVQEGSFIKKNSLLAQLGTAATELRLEQARLALDEATFNKNDLLVMQGGQWGKDTSVNETTLQSIFQQSGYKKALHAIKQLDYELAQARIIAPFDGVVAELKAGPHQHLNAGETLCTLMDPLSFGAVFQLLEKEAVQVSVGQAVKIQLLTGPGKELRAAVSSINPMVDEHGLVRFHAVINKDDLRRHRSGLLEGMNLRAVIEKGIPRQLPVPKSAVVLRSGRPVIFTYDEASGLAKWNFVTVAYENDMEVAISEGLKPGDLVIYEGNLNLDHDAEVEAAPKASTPAKF